MHENEIDLNELPYHGSDYVGAYIVTHVASGNFYIGSTGRFRKRRSEHLHLLKVGGHHHDELQRLYNESPLLTFKLYATGKGEVNVDTREKAFDFEQELLDEHWGNPLLLNHSRSARSVILEGERLAKRQEVLRALRMDPAFRVKFLESLDDFWNDPERGGKRLKEMAEMRRTPEYRALQATITAKKWEDPEYRAKMAASKRSPEYLAKARTANARFTKRVIVAGTEYESIKAAALALKMSRNTLKKRCRDNSYPDYKVTLVAEQPAQGHDGVTV